MLNYLETLDLIISGYIHNMSGQYIADQFFLLVSNHRVFAVVFIIYCICLARKRQFQELKVIALMFLAIGLVDAICFFILKPFFGRIRPCHAIELYEAVSSCGGKFSHPSNHAANMMALAVFIGPYVRAKKGKLIFFLAVLVGFSRIYLGVHYFFDVIVGFLVGGLIAHTVRKALIRAGLLHQKAALVFD